MKNELFLFAGEKSGDMHGGHLMKALKDRLPQLEMTGVGGESMRSQGLQSLLQTEDFEVMGFSAVILTLPKLWKQFRLVRDYILKKKPKVAVFIDYPGFNLRMAKTLRQKGYQGKIVQFISPSVWAWGKNRMAHMAETLDLLLTIFPFESKCFSETTLNVRFVGNPIKEYVSHYQYDESWRQKMEIPACPLISLFPGSRSIEIKRHLGIQLEAAALLKADLPNVSFAVSCGHRETESLVEQMLHRSPLKLKRDVFLVPKKYAYEMMRDSQSAIAKSGTVTLELALHQQPTVVIYKTSLANRLFVKHVIRPQVAHFCIVNILTGREVFPELIANGLTSKNVYQEIKRLNINHSERQACIEACRNIHGLLDIDNASDRAAGAIEKLLT